MKNEDRPDIMRKGSHRTEMSSPIEREVDFIPVRVADSLAAVPYRHSKHQPILLYTYEQLCLASRDICIDAHFTFLHRILLQDKRHLVWYFDLDQNTIECT